MLGPGTGLGEAQLFWDDAMAAYRVCPSEGAHSGFAPRGWKQLMLCHHVERELGHVDVEHVREALLVRAGLGWAGLGALAYW